MSRLLCLAPEAERRASSRHMRPQPEPSSSTTRRLSAWTLRCRLSSQRSIPMMRVRHPKASSQIPTAPPIVTLMGLNPLHLEFGVRNIVAASYQAVSGSGAQGIAELDSQVNAIVARQPVVKSVYLHQIAFNVIPHVDTFEENGYTREEMKMQNEGRKILHHPELRASVTCVRVPVYRSHSVAVTASFEKPVDVERARACIDAAPGVRVCDDPSMQLYPTPLDTSEKDDCLVGRMRRDLVFENGLTFWVVGRSGAQRCCTQRSANR